MNNTLNVQFDLKPSEIGGVTFSRRTFQASVSMDADETQMLKILGDTSITVKIQSREREKVNALLLTEGEKWKSIVATDPQKSEDAQAALIAVWNAFSIAGNYQLIGGEKPLYRLDEKKKKKGKTKFSLI